MSRDDPHFHFSQTSNQRFQEPTRQRPSRNYSPTAYHHQYANRSASNYQQNGPQQQGNNKQQQGAYTPSQKNFPVPRNTQQDFRGNTQVRQPNPEPPTSVHRENGLCSLFLIKTTPNSKAYRYDVDILNTIRQKSLTKACDDGQRALNRRLCYDILVAAHIKTEGFGMTDDGEVVYDNRTTIYTSTPLNMSKSFINVDKSEVSEFVQRYCKDACFVVTILPNATNQVLDLSDLSQYISKKSLVEEDRSLRTFLEMASSQHSVNCNLYTPHGSGKLFETSELNNERVGNGMVLRSGLVKGVRVVQNGGIPAPALVIDSKVCPFFEPQNLLSTVSALCSNKLPAAKDLSARCLKTLQDVRVEVRYAPHRSFGIGRFSDKPLKEMLTVFQGQKVGMDKFFELKYNIKLKHPDLPGVIPNTPRPKDNTLEVFPIEELLVMPGQVVPLDKMSKQLSDMLLKSNSMLPKDRLSKIMRHAESIALFDERNAVLHAFGIQVLRNSNEVVIGVRPCPRLRFANNRFVNANPERSEWARDATSQSYIDASELHNWIVLCSMEHEKLVQAFIQKLIKMAQKKLMRYSQPIIRTFENNKWQTVFENCINKNIEFVMLIDRKEVDSHGLLKFLEARHKVLTQQVTLEKVSDVVKANKNQILENIVNKTNCKNFGLNYVPVMEQCGQSFNLERGEVLVIGYDVAHPGNVSSTERRILRANGVMADSLDPSVVGICANMAKHPYSFVGDYFYQESRKEAVDTTQLAERTHWILEQLKKNRPKQDKPKQIFVLRDGLSEGQTKMALKDELAAIKQGCLDYSPNYCPQFLFAIGTKRHFKKFFAVRDGRVENLAPGSVISEKMVREDCPEFFMQSHYPLKGVGKAVEYSVPVNEMQIGMDELQAFLNALCYDHQIVNSAISLPEPIYQADELAKRGHNNFLAMKKADANNIPRLHTRLVDFQALTQMLSYKNSNLSSTRFSA